MEWISPRTRHVIRLLTGPRDRTPVRPSTTEEDLTLNDSSSLSHRLWTEFGPALNGAPPTVIRDAIDRHPGCGRLDNETKNSLVDLIRGWPDEPLPAV
jgi:hypothetical protein